MRQKYFAGIDIGSSATKTVIIDERAQIVGSRVVRTGFSYELASRESFDQALNNAGIDETEIAFAISTGYGRSNTPLSNAKKTEISCLSKGAYHHFPFPISVIDVGGQDNKMISVDAGGKTIDFQMNRKCAAGTGAFLEDIANRLDLELEELGELAQEGSEGVELGSYCTVFTFTEILSHLKSGVSMEDLARAVLLSIVKRIVEFGIVQGDLVLSGGVIHHFKLIGDMLKRELDFKIHIPPEPQLLCAFGAALYARKTTQES